jgi:SAM-dependent methyltransferase
VPEFVNRFAGTAVFYAQYRPGYPVAVYDFISEMAGLDDRNSSMLDLGCGPGVIALALADRVHSVVGVDPDRGMLEQAELARRESGAHNVRWICSTAEDFDDEPGTYDLITIGSAFHWMDRAVLAERMHQLLRPGGVLALLGNPTPLMDIREGKGVGDAIRRVQDRWLGPEQRPALPQDFERHEDVVSTSSFGYASIYYFPSRQWWNVDHLIGFLQSTSWRPDQVLGNRFRVFVEELRSAIREVEPSGEWIERHDVELIVARR